MKSSITLTMAALCLATAVGCDKDKNTDDTPDGSMNVDMGSTGTDGGTPDGTVVIQGDGGTTDGTVVTVDAAVDMAPHELTPDEFVTSIAGILCDRAACLAAQGDTGLLISRVVIGSSTGAECTERVKTFLLGQPGTAPLAEIEAGRMLFHADRAASCLTTFETGDCGMIFSDESCLDTVFTGNVAIGDHCTRDDDNKESECVEGATCVSGGSLCGGTCEALVALGDACTSGEQCAPYRYDNSEYNCEIPPEGSSTVCILRVSANDAAEGDECGHTTFLGSTSTYTRHECVHGFHCDGYQPGTPSSSEVPGRCVANGDPGALGEGCYKGDPTSCESGLACMDGTCIGIVTTTTVGADCGFTSSGIALCDSAEGVACQLTGGGDAPTGQCVAIGDGAEGSVCGGGFAKIFGRGCDDGLFCTSDETDFPGLAGECVTLIANGDRCERDFNCASGYCDQEAGGGAVCGDLPVCL